MGDRDMNPQVKVEGWDTATELRRPGNEKLFSKGPKRVIALECDLKVWGHVTIQPVWPDKNCQMSIKVAQKWFH